MPILWSYLAYCTTPYCALWEVFRHQKMIRLRRIWQCHDCHQGVVIPGIYINIHGETIKIDPNAPEAHKNPWSKHWSYAFLTIIPWFQHSIIPCRRPPSVVKSYMISIYYRNSETFLISENRDVVDKVHKLPVSVPLCRSVQERKSDRMETTNEYGMELA